LQPLSAAKGQTIEIDAPPTLPPIWADPACVTRVLTNLASNAHKYTPQGGRIWIGVEDAGAMLRVSVSDSGIGMNEQELEKLFTRFFRAQNAYTEQVAGTGLGLSIARSLVEMQGGEISVSSVPGEGSTFAFTVPVASRPANAGGVGGTLQALPGRRI